MNPTLWQPTPEAIVQTQMFAFMQQVSTRYGVNLYHYQDLYQWSIDHTDDFWAMMAEYAGLSPLHGHWCNDWVVSSHHRAHDISQKSSGSFNYAQHLLKNQDNTLAVQAFDETGEQVRLTRRELYQRVATAQQALHAAGVQQGDVVAALLPNIPEAIIFMLATTAMGAIWTSCSPDFGVPGILDRFSQVAPRLLITAPGYTHKSRWIDCKEKNQHLQQALPSLLRTISIDEVLPIATHVNFEPVSFDHPAFILYSSGTTGMPKCIVHGHGGTLIQHMKELMLHTDLRVGEKLLYLTTCGWMMWNWMVSALGVGACVVLYEGSPLYPHVDSLLKVLSQAKVHVFGTSAKFLSTWQKAGVRAMDTSALASVRTILSTGSPLMPDTFDYVYESLKQDVCLASIAGGTDIISCFALGCPMLPVYQGELQCRGLGMAVEIWDEEGRAVVEQQGELVCVKPFPSMPLKFWNDPDDKKYRQAYFSRFESVWTHGDYAMLKANGGLMIFGRSDAVLNPGGVRIGTAEIYRQVETLPAILESLAVGLERDGNQDILLFVILAPHHTLTESLVAEIKQKLRQNASPRHVPSQIIAVKDFPRTVNGKVSELAVTKILNDRPVDNVHALANPEVLEVFKELRERL